MSNKDINLGQTADSVIVLDGSPTVSTHFSGSVSGRLDVPCGAIVHVHGVLEDAFVSGAGMVRVSGLIAGVFSFDGGSVLARPGSVPAPEVDGEPWRVLHRSGTWTESVCRPEVPVS